MEENNVKKKIVMVIVLGLVVLALGIGGVYAYFAATVTQDTTSNVSISAVSGLAISFSNSANIEASNAIPGMSWTKTFSATLTNNKTAIGVTYSVVLHITKNTFNSSRGYLTYTLTGAENVSETQITKLDAGNLTIVQDKTISGTDATNEVKHTYTLTINYPNNANSVQQQGGEFSGYVYFTAGENKIGNQGTSQSGSSGVKYFSNEVEIAREDLTVGDIVQIEEEEFYVLPVDENWNVIDNNNKIHALAKYNLNLDDNMQSESDWSVTEFSNDDVHGIDCQDKYKLGGACYTTYEGSLVQVYVNHYVDNLRSIVSNVEGSLITKTELEILGCDYSVGTCEGAFEWVWNTNYWSSSLYGVNTVWYVYSYGNFVDIYFDYSGYFGVRPVIIF